jgi:SAM-dependent methyltransferase
MSGDQERAGPDDRRARVEDEQAARDAPDWPAYYRHTIGREPRPLFVKGVSLARSAGLVPGLAVEIGFGDGTETLALLADGWRVLAVDPTPEARDVLLARVPRDAEERLEVRTRSADGLDLPPFDLLYAGFALSFLERRAFGHFWTEVRAAVRPGGFIVVNVFGEKDTWAGDAYMTFVARAEVERMVGGLEVLALDEEDADGTSFVGDKHWHVFDIVARRPPA